MGQKYLASLLAVAMFAAGVPCAQAEELDNARILAHFRIPALT